MPGAPDNVRALFPESALAFNCGKRSPGDRRGYALAALRGGPSPIVSQWVVPLVAALIGATATLVTAYITYVKDRKNQRSLILQDLEIADKLPEDSQAQKVLRTYAENRARLLPLESYIQWLKGRELYGFGALVLFLTLGIIAAVTNTSYVIMIFATTLALLYPLVFLWSFTNDRNKLIDRYLNQANAWAHIEAFYPPRYPAILGGRLQDRWLERRRARS